MKASSSHPADVVMWCRQHKHHNAAQGTCELTNDTGKTEKVSTVDVIIDATDSRMLKQKLHICNVVQPILGFKSTSYCEFVLVRIFSTQKRTASIGQEKQRFQATCKHESSCWMGKCPTSTPSHSTLDAQAFVWHEEWKAWHEKLSSREGYALLGDCLSDFCLPDWVPLFVWLIPGGEAKTLPSTDTIFPKALQGLYR